MTVRERILILKLIEKQQKQPDYTERIGIQTGIVLRKQKRMEEKNV